MNKYTILIVEDEINIRNFTTTILQTHCYNVISASTCEEGILMYNSYNPDMIILDLGLPDKSGLELIKEIKKKNNVPIIVLSARTGEDDKVNALDLGANDYITKPFGTNELVARVRAVFRNVRNIPTASHKINVGDLCFDFDNRKITLLDEEVKLTRTEYNILVYLVEHSGKLLTYDMIINKIWGSSDEYSIKKLQVNMANIRRKLGIRPGDNLYITNELGIGYRFCYDQE